MRSGLGAQSVPLPPVGHHAGIVTREHRRGTQMASDDAGRRLDRYQPVHGGGPGEDAFVLPEMVDTHAGTAVVADGNCSLGVSGCGAIQAVHKASMVGELLHDDGRVASRW
jgi:hypothetical protein